MRPLTAAFILSLVLTPALAAQSRSCTISAYGKSCGPVFTGTVVPNGNTDKVTMTISKAAPSSRVLIIVGKAKTDIDLRPLFGGTLDCRLLVTPNFMQQHRTDPAGRFSWGHALPSTHIGVAYAQCAELRSDGKVLTTNGLALDCK